MNPYRRSIAPMRLKFVLPHYFVVTAAFSSILFNKFDPENIKTNDHRLTEVVQKVVDTWATHDVTIISHNHTLDHKVNRLVNTISKIVLHSYPTHHFQIVNLLKEQLNFQLNGLQTATSRTLIFFVYHYPRLQNKTAIAIARCLSIVTHKKHSAKVLLMPVADAEGVNMSQTLTNLFDVGHSSLIALEVSTKSDGTLSPTYVHRYNRFTTGYTRMIYNGNVSDWYIDQYQNLKGSTLRLCYHNTTSNRFNKLMQLQLEVFREKMNVSFALVPISERKCTMTYQSYYLFHNQLYDNASEHTVPMHIDGFCLFIPNLLQRRSGNMSWGLSMALLVGVFIIALVLGFSTLAGIGTFNRPFNVIAVMLGTYLDIFRSSSLTEKILYLCLVQVATRYMSLLYTELFSEAAAAQRELNIDDFEDLYGLDLKIKMDSSWYNFFANSTDSIVPPKVLPMFEVISNNNSSDAFEGNVGYFSMQLLQLYQQQLMIRPKKKKSNLCLGSVSIVQMLPMRLWYKERMNDLLLRINQYGFRNHANEWNFKWVGGQTVDMEQRVDDSPSAQKRMAMSLLYGYLLVVFIFVGELLVGWFRAKKIANLVLRK